MNSERIVVDNNALVSRLLLPASVPGRAIRKAFEVGQLLISEGTLEELANVLSRPKFDRYVTVRDRQEFLRLLVRVAEIVPVVYTVRACRDPKDDMFLNVALSGSANVIVTGDKDLLVLSPFQNIPIISPSAYLLR